MNPSPRDLLIPLRLLEAMREIGILLIAFAPLDYAVSGTGRYGASLSVFVIVGLVLVLGAILGEWRLQR